MVSRMSSAEGGGVAVRSRGPGVGSGSPPPGSPFHETTVRASSLRNRLLQSRHLQALPCPHVPLSPRGPPDRLSRPDSAALPLVRLGVRPTFPAAGVGVREPLGPQHRAQMPRRDITPLPPSGTNAHDARQAHLSSRVPHLRATPLVPALPPGFSCLLQVQGD